jgi:hypothetical protein
MTNLKDMHISDTTGNRSISASVRSRVNLLEELK